MIVVTSECGSFSLNDDYYLLRDGETMIPASPQEQALHEQLCVLENMIRASEATQMNETNETDDYENLWDGWN